MALVRLVVLIIPDTREDNGGVRGELSLAPLLAVVLLDKYRLAHLAKHSPGIINTVTLDLL